MPTRGPGEFVRTAELTTAAGLSWPDNATEQAAQKPSYLVRYIVCYLGPV